MFGMFEHENFAILSRHIFERIAHVFVDFFSRQPDQGIVAAVVEQFAFGSNFERDKPSPLAVLAAPKHQDVAKRNPIEPRPDAGVVTKLFTARPRSHTHRLQ